MGGVNDWIAKGLGDMWSCTPIVPSAENPMEGIGRLIFILATSVLKTLDSIPIIHILLIRIRENAVC